MQWAHLLMGLGKDAKNEATETPTMGVAESALERKLPLEEGLEHLKAGRLDHAVVALRIALQREPGRFAAVRGLATAFVMSDDARSARLLLDSYTTDHPMSAEGWRLAAQLEWKLNQRPRAVEILYAGLKRLPHSGILHRQLAVFLAADGHLADASKHAEQAPAAEGGLQIEKYIEAAASPESTSGKKLLRETPRAQDANDHDWLDQIAADPVLLKAILSPIAGDEGALPENTRQMLRNIEWKLGRLLEAQPDHADRQLLLARVQARLDAIPAAMLSLQRALRVNPRLIEAHRLKAQLHARIGEVDQAIGVLEGLLAQGILWPDVHYELADLERQRGRAAEARNHLYSAIRLNPRFDEAHALLERCAA